MKNPQVDDRIRVSWALNNACQEGDWNENALKIAAYKYLRLFDEMIKELPDPVCESCHGVCQYGGEPIVNGLHPACRKSESFKQKDL